MAPVNQRYTLVLSPDMFLDADADKGDQLEISAAREDRSPLPAWLTFDPETLAFAGTPTDADVGQFNVSVIAKDTQGAEGVDTFLLEVRPESDLPSAPIASVRRVVIPANGRVPVIIDWSAGREASQGRPRYQLGMRTMGKKGLGQVRDVAQGDHPDRHQPVPQAGHLPAPGPGDAAGGKPGAWVEGAPFTLSHPPGDGHVASSTRVRGPRRPGRTRSEARYAGRSTR